MRKGIETAGCFPVVFAAVRIPSREGGAEPDRLQVTKIGRPQKAMVCPTGMAPGGSGISQLRASVAFSPYRNTSEIVLVLWIGLALDQS
jgi:hypothetical protein